MGRAPRESCDLPTGTHDGGTLECAAVGVLSLFAHETRMSPTLPRHALDLEHRPYHGRLETIFSVTLPAWHANFLGI